MPGMRIPLPPHTHFVPRYLPLPTALVPPGPGPRLRRRPTFFRDHRLPASAARVSELLLVAFTPKDSVLVASAGYNGATGFSTFILPQLDKQPSLVFQTDAGVLLPIDGLTAPGIVITTPSEDSGGGGFCGAAGALDGGGDLGGDRGNDVMVLQRGSTADYDYVVVGGDTGESITEWLTMAGYVLPADYADALTPYIDGGTSIFAAKVKSNRCGRGSGADRAAPARRRSRRILDPLRPRRVLLQPGGHRKRSTTCLLAHGSVVTGGYTVTTIDDDDLIPCIGDRDQPSVELYDFLIAGPGGAWVIDASLDQFATGGLDGGRQHRRQEQTRRRVQSRGRHRLRRARRADHDASMSRVRIPLGAIQLCDAGLRRRPTGTRSAVLCTSAARRTPWAAAKSSAPSTANARAAAAGDPLLLLRRCRR